MCGTDSPSARDGWVGWLGRAGGQAKTTNSGRRTKKRRDGSKNGAGFEKNEAEPNKPGKESDRRSALDREAGPHARRLGHGPPPGTDMGPEGPPILQEYPVVCYHWRLKPPQHRPTTSEVGRCHCAVVNVCAFLDHLRQTAFHQPVTASCRIRSLKSPEVAVLLCNIFARAQAQCHLPCL